MNYEVMKSAFEDELRKIKEAGSLQGHVRSNRRPISADNLLKKEKDSSGEARKKLADLTKLSNVLDAKTVAGVAAGAYALNRLQKMRRRYELGRQMEMQQSQGMY